MEFATNCLKVYTSEFTLLDVDYEHSEYDVTFRPLRDPVYVDSFYNRSLSVAGYEIHMRRWIQPFIFNVYLPTGVLVLISFVSFSVPVDQA